ncbi:MAG: ABC transporter ATP-binding protein [Eubacterium sp.]|nr:ABC transporter ATP-binding protein [Eubacterium sp.]
MIQFQKVNKQLGEFALQNISFELPKGYVMGLIGENGAGKTSLLHLILGLYLPDSGKISIMGNTYGEAEREIKNKTGYVVLDEQLFLSATSLVDNAKLYGRFYADYDGELLLDYCGQFALDPHKRWKSLSKGEKLKFQFAFALAHHPKLLVLDEPTANFDPQFREQFMQILANFVSDGEKSVILATHQMQELDQIADYITFLHRGKLVFSAEKETVTDKLRIVSGAPYKVNLLKEERVICKEIKNYAAAALVRHRDRDTYDSALTVSIPTMEDVMYYLIKSGKLDG